MLVDTQSCLSRQEGSEPLASRVKAQRAGSPLKTAGGGAEGRVAPAREGFVGFRAGSSTELERDEFARWMGRWRQAFWSIFLQVQHGDLRGTQTPWVRGSGLT